MHTNAEWMLWNHVLERLQGGATVAFITVVAHEKGSPGKTGFKMAITADGESLGTIGGGVMEHSMKEQYAERLRDGKDFCELRTLVHALQSKRGEPSGLTCAGSETICAMSLRERDIPCIASILEAVTDHLPAVLELTTIGMSCTHVKQPVHATFEQVSAFGWTYRENIGPEYALYIIGGGHVGAALSRIAAGLNFYVVVYDDREGLHMPGEDVDADKKIVDAYSRLASHIAEPRKSFAAIVTSDFTTDTIALRQLLPLRLPYVGIMGVESKIVRIKNSLSPEEQEEFGRQHIYAPIGMRIDSSTADEIAVSIAGELISVRNRLGRK
jgi:xanthine dehydrogenase accessory factor